MSELADLTKRQYALEQKFEQMDKGMGDFFRFVNQELAKVQVALEAFADRLPESSVIVPPQGIIVDG